MGRIALVRGEKLGSWLFGGLSGWFAKSAIEGEGDIALGVSEYLDEFAKKVGGSTWKTWGAKDFESQFIEAIGNSANKIHFNLDGVGNLENPRIFTPNSHVNLKLISRGREGSMQPIFPAKAIACFSVIHSVKDSKNFNKVI